MVRGLCGAMNLQSICMVDNKYTKTFPRDLVHETRIGDDGYPHYSRRKSENGGYTTTIRVRNADVVIDNRWIVPYFVSIVPRMTADPYIRHCCFRTIFSDKL
ncbi:hypothetical protein HNY73_007853 [Argiope bruennichi]|uniref:Uncharacterized protein n=1 Tax=Argiope bruennichi TaxID=94029 RepID=A0A8T0F9G8_ARGBR|nr:hypothetical protein HNY73_007853 [Argiope bruennichi]